MINMISNKKINIARHFNRAATSYDDAASMQQFAGDELIKYLSLNKEKCILDLGCGTGLTTKHLIETIYFEQCYATDIAEVALNKAKHTIHNEKVSLLLQDFDQLQLPDKQFSLIFSNMALHWSSHFSTLLNVLNSLLLPNGTLAFSMPLTGTLIELHPDNIRPFHHLQEIATLLKKANFEIHHQTQHQYVQIFTHVMEALYSLKKTGVTHLDKKNRCGLKSKKYLLDLFYDKKHPPSLTYEIGIFICKRA